MEIEILPHEYAKTRHLIYVLTLVNMISYFRDDLRRIIDGERAIDFLSKKDRHRLARMGIIESAKPRVRARVPWEIEALLDRLK